MHSADRLPGPGFPMEAALIALGLVGYASLAALFGILNLEMTTEVSVAFRVTVVLIALLIILGRPCDLSGPAGYMMAAFVFFWSLYLWRIGHETLIEHNILPLSGTKYLAYTVVFSIMPALGVLWASPTGQAIDRAGLLAVLAGGLGCLIGVYILTSTFQGLQLLYEQRYYITKVDNAFAEKLNPILMGHFGASVALIAMAAPESLRRLPFSLAIRLALIAVGVFLMIAAAAKGPVVAFAVAILAWQFIRADGAGRIVLGVGLAIAFLLFSDFAPLDAVRGVTMFQRFEDALLYTSADNSTTGRLGLYESAWAQFGDSPFLGDTLATRWPFSTYPHNLVLEVGMAMGIVGLVPLCVILALSLRACHAGLRRRSPNTWLYMIAIQHLANAMVSGGLSTATWPLFAMAAFRLDLVERRAGRPAGDRAAPAGLAHPGRA